MSGAAAIEARARCRLDPVAPAGSRFSGMGIFRASWRAVTEKASSAVTGSVGMRRSHREMCGVCARNGMDITRWNTITRIVDGGEVGRRRGLRLHAIRGRHRWCFLLPSQRKGYMLVRIPSACYPVLYFNLIAAVSRSARSLIAKNACAGHMAALPVATVHIDPMTKKEGII